MILKIMTFNIRHSSDFNAYLEDGSDKIDFNVPSDIINEFGADIVGLNEVNGEGVRADFTPQAEEIGKLTNKNAFFAPAIDIEGAGLYGNALLSKLPVKEFKNIPIPDPLVKDEKAYYETRCLIKAVIDLGGKDITVFVSHFGLANGEKKNAVSTVLKELSGIKTPIILMGDFNMRPENELLKPFYERFNEVDAKNNEFTCRSDKPKVKIDYIFLSKDIKVIKSKVIKKIASDHFALTTEVEI